MLTSGVGNSSSTFDSSKLHERPGIQSQAAAAVVTIDTDMDTSLRERLVRTRIPSIDEKSWPNGLDNLI